MKKIYIVTGGTGFVGNNVIKKLEEKNESVITLCRSEKKVKRALANSKAKVFYGDVLNMADLEKLFTEQEKCNYIFIHTASVVYLGSNRKRIAEMFNVNINGAKNVIEVCKKHNARLVYVSSVHAITEQPKRGLITESETFEPKSVVGKYAKSKASASRLVMNSIKNDGLNAVLVHPSGITGPNDFSDTHLYQMVEDYANGRIPAATSGGYDFVDVRDVADGIITAAEKGKAGSCYLLTNQYYSVKQMLDILYELGAGKKVKMKLPMFFARLGLPFLTLHFKIHKKRPLYSSYSLYTLRSNSNFSHEKATAELNFKPRGLKESLADTVTFMRENNKEK